MNASKNTILTRYIWCMLLIKSSIYSMYAQGYDIINYSMHEKGTGKQLDLYDTINNSFVNSLIKIRLDYNVDKKQFKEIVKGKNKQLTNNLGKFNKREINWSVQNEKKSQSNSVSSLLDTVYSNCNDTIICITTISYSNYGDYEVSINSEEYHSIDDLLNISYPCMLSTTSVYASIIFEPTHTMTLEYINYGSSTVTYGFSYNSFKEIIDFFNNNNIGGSNDWYMPDTNYVAEDYSYQIQTDTYTELNNYFSVFSTVDPEIPTGPSQWLYGLNSGYSVGYGAAIAINVPQGCKLVIIRNKYTHEILYNHLFYCAEMCPEQSCVENLQCDSLNIPTEEIVSLKQPCLDVDSGRIIINYTNLVNNYFSPNCAENLTYTIQKDDLYNHHWDEQCISEPSIVHTITNDTIFDALPYGDYTVQIKCTPVVNDTCLGTNLMPLGNFEDTSYWFGHNIYEDIHPNEVFYDGDIYTNNGYNQSNILPGQMLFIKNQHYFNAGNAVDTCVDHSTGNGYMLGIQGMKGGGGEIFRDSVSIQNCTKYQFKFYYKKLGNGGGGYNSIRSPRLIVLINNQFVPLEKEILHDDISQDYWHEMIYTWYSGNQTQAVVTIKDFNRFNTPYYVLDDLSFRDIKQCGLPVDCPVKTFVSLDPKHFNIVDDLYFICPKDTLPIFIDSSLFTRVNSWSYCCQEHSGELDPSKKTDITPDNFFHYYTGGTFGGYFYVEAQTYQGCHASDTGFIVDFNSPGLELKEIDSVLNVSASKFRSIWKPIYSSIQWSSIDELMTFKNKLSYNKGMFGMYRPRQVFDYIDNRIQSKNNLNETDVKLKMDGTFNDFKMFNWYHSRFAECAPEWKLNHTITNYNPGSFEIENKDILNVYSTALYGYGGKLETAVAANADYEEIGYENFEEYSSSDFNTINQLNNTTGNLDIVPKILGLKYPYMLEYDIESAFGRYALVKNIEGNLCCDIPLNVFFQGRTLETNLGPKSIKSQEVSMKATVLVSNTNCNDKDPDLKLVTFQTTDKSRPYPFANGQYCDRFWTGTLLVEKEIPVAEQTFTKISLSSTKAHSGKNSVLIDTGFTSIPQYDLHLKAGKNYVVSAWIHVDDNTSDSYFNLSPEQLETFNNSNRIGVSLKVGNLSTMLYPSGEVIEGWQRLEGVVHVVDKDKIPSLEFMNTKKLYLDDIRIYPENGSIQTYVYDPSNYRLKAVLDQNNYATFYQYDDEGNLFSVKKETVKGIKTIQATQNYIKTKQ